MTCGHHWHCPGIVCDIRMCEYGLLRIYSLMVAKQVQRCLKGKYSKTLGHWAELLYLTSRQWARAGFWIVDFNFSKGWLHSCFISLAGSASGSYSYIHIFGTTTEQREMKLIIYSPSCRKKRIYQLWRICTKYKTKAHKQDCKDDVCVRLSWKVTGCIILHKATVQHYVTGFSGTGQDMDVNVEYFQHYYFQGKKRRVSAVKIST